MSEIILNPGIKGKMAKIVGKEETAAAYGSGLVEVFATPAMVALMENTCLKSVESRLPETHSTVGMKISVSHEKATPVGMQVTCESALVEVDRKRLVFSVEARDEEGIIGRGTHERFIIEKERFMNKIRQS
jgi:predicted thioesterase